MSEELLNIRLSPESYKLMDRLAKLSPSLDKTVQGVANNAVKGATKLALASYKSKIPIDTLNLRGTNLDNGFLVEKVNGDIAIIEIKSGIHVNRHGKRQPATKLADILQKGVGEKGGILHRTQDSAAIGIEGAAAYGSEPRRSKTKDWEGKAFRAFISPAKLGAYLKNTDFTKRVL